MKSTRYTIFLIGACAVLLALILCTSVGRRIERYGNIVGAAGQYRSSYFECVRKCEKSDPRQRLSQNAWACGMACDHLVTNANRGDKKSRRKLSAYVSTDDKCERACARAKDPMACREACVCATNVNAYCVEECDYAPPGAKDCVPQCTAAHSARCGSNGNATSWSR